MKKGIKDEVHFGKRAIRIFLPFILLLFGFAAVSVIQKQDGREPNSGVAEGNAASPPSPKPTVSTLADPTASPPQITTITPNDDGLMQASPISTITITATSLPPANIQIHGPPENSVFSLQTPVTIYWAWPFDQVDSQRFAVYLQDDSGEYLAGATNETSLGNQGFQLNFIPADIVRSDGTYLLQIRLEEIDHQVITATSVPRAIVFTKGISG